MTLVSLTGFDALSQFLSAATSRSVLLDASGALTESVGLLSRACNEASLPVLAGQLLSSDPMVRAEAFHTMAASEELGRRIAAHFGPSEDEALRAKAGRLRAGTQGRNLSGLKILFFGDIHDNWGPVRKIVDHECADGNGVVLAVGDLVTYKRLRVKVPFLFCYGNHEDEAQLDAIHRGRKPLGGSPYPLFSGEWALIQGGLTVGAISGIYEGPVFDAGAPHVFPFFSKKDVSRTLRTPLPLDIFLSHEAPAGVGLTRRGRDLGSPVVTGVLEKLQPKVAFFGHHHQEFDGSLGKTRLIGLGYPKRSYVKATVDPASGELRFERHRSKLVENGPSKVYRYEWERDLAPEERTSERLFSFGVATLMDREEEAAGMLDKKYRGRLSEHLVPIFLPRVGKQGDSERTKRLLAEGLANGVFNTVLPYFARYFVSLKATLSTKERDLLQQKILREMLTDKSGISFAQDDLALAFTTLCGWADRLS